MTRVLVVEDEPAIAELISMVLRHASMEVILATSADQAQAVVHSVLPDLVLLDWMLPGLSGPDLVRRWRADGRTRDLPVILLTARAAEADKVSGLDAGADDYLTKPFSPKELLARTRAVLRRKAPETLRAVIKLGPLQLDPGTHRVLVAGETLKLGPTEFRLLHYMMSHPERVHGRASLLDKVWGDHVFIEERTVDVHVKRLRDALVPSGCAAMVETVRGAGYRITALNAAPG